MFVERITLSPDRGKNRELRAHVAESEKRRQADGQKISLSTSVFGDDVGSLIITIRFNDLSEFEKQCSVELGEIVAHRSTPFRLPRTAAS